MILKVFERKCNNILKRPFKCFGGFCSLLGCKDVWGRVMYGAVDAVIKI